MNNVVFVTRPLPPTKQFVFVTRPLPPSKPCIVTTHSLPLQTMHFCHAPSHASRHCIFVTRPLPASTQCICVTRSLPPHNNIFVKRYLPPSKQCFLSCALVVAVFNNTQGVVFHGGKSSNIIRGRPLPFVIRLPSILERGLSRQLPRPTRSRPESISV